MSSTFSTIWLCVFILHGTFGYSDLDQKLQKLEAKFEDTVAKLTSENEDLRVRMKILEGLISNSKNNEPLPKQKTDTNGMIYQQDPTRHLSNADYQVKSRKRIVPPTTSPTGIIAFHAYLSRDSTGSLPRHYVLKFDTVSLNKGNGYNAFDGIFIVPAAGTYVFTWSFMSDAHGTVHTQLMKNANVIGTRYADSTTASVWDFTTGIVVVDVAFLDHVYVRLGTESRGEVLSVAQSKNTFSGWRLN